MSSSLSRRGFLVAAAGAAFFPTRALEQLTAPVPVQGLRDFGPQLKLRDLALPDDCELILVAVSRGFGRWQMLRLMTVSAELVHDQAADVDAHLAWACQQSFLDLQANNPGRASVPVTEEGSYRIHYTGSGKMNLPVGDDLESYLHGPYFMVRGRLIDA